MSIILRTDSINTLQQRKEFLEELSLPAMMENLVLDLSSAIIIIKLNKIHESRSPWTKDHRL